MTTAPEPLWQPFFERYYADNEALRHILVTHSRSVADKALEVARCHPELEVDLQFLEEAAMLHDIGVFLTNAPGIHCFGCEPYIRHGLIGANLLRRHGLPRHARVAERHTGTGLTAQAIVEQSLPLPVRDFLPETIEEQIVCYADKFFSKTHLERVRSKEQVLRSLEKFGQESVERMKAWMERFEP